MGTLKQTSARDVLDAIFARHCGPEWVRFAEVADSTGTHARRRADAVCMNIWPSKGFALHGFEIKVSRADFLHEMKDVTKSEAVGRYCDFWWLVTPNGLVDPKEVPDSWGLMILQKNGLKIKKQAPKRANVEEPSRGFMASLLRKSRDADDAYIKRQINAGQEAARESLRREMAHRIEQAEKQAARNATWIEEFETALGEQFRGFEKPAAMAERLKVARSLEFGDVSRLMQSCAAVVHEIGALGKAMQDGRGVGDD